MLVKTTNVGMVPSVVPMSTVLRTAVSVRHALMDLSVKLVSCSDTTQCKDHHIK